MADRVRREMRAIVAALRLVWVADKRSAILILAAQVLAAAGLLAQLWALRRLLEVLSGPPDGQVLVVPVAVLAVAGLAVSVAGTVVAETRFVANERVVRMVVTSVLEAANKCDLTNFENDEFHDALNRATYNTSGRVWSAVWSSINLLSATISIAVLGAALSIVAPSVLAIAALGALVPFVVSRRNNRLLFELSYAYTADDRRRVGLQGLLTRQASVPEVRAYQAERVVLQRVRALFDERVRRVEEVVRTRLLRNTIASIVSYLFGVAAVIFLLREVTNGSLEFADGAVSLVVLQQVSGRMRSASGAMVELSEAMLYLKDYEAFMDIVAGMPARTRGERLPSSPIEAVGLTFRYEGAEHDAVAAVSLKVKPGEVAAIVGENGSGKSTLAKLLAGLYQPAIGSVLWDGQPCARQDLQASTALMFQDFQRYPLSLRDNVVFGDIERSLASESYEQAMSQSGVEDLARQWPRGEDTILSREYLDGIQLSGGEWQRVAIARAFYRNAPVLIMDEPSASLDPRRESQLFESLRSLFADRVVIFISHRLSTVRTADRIYVMRSGRVAEEGSHDELLAAGGDYAELWKLQSTSSV